MINKLKCFLFGHKRGKRADDMPLEPGRIWYRCPRCPATWARKVKAKVAA